MIERIGGIKREARRMIIEKRIIVGKPWSVLYKKERITILRPQMFIDVDNIVEYLFF